MQLQEQMFGCRLHTSQPVARRQQDADSKMHSFRNRGMTNENETSDATARGLFLSSQMTQAAGVVSSAMHVKHRGSTERQAVVTAEQFRRSEMATASSCQP